MYVLFIIGSYEWKEFPHEIPNVNLVFKFNRFAQLKILARVPLFKHSGFPRFSGII